MIHEIAARFDKTQTSDASIFSSLLENSDLDTVEYIIAEETAKISKKIHYHVQLNINSHNAPKSVRKSVRTLCKTMGLTGPQMYVKGTKDILKHLTYLTKDCKVIIDNWKNRELLNEAKASTSRINEEKKKKMKHQLLEYAQSLEPPSALTGLLSVDFLAVSVINYHVERDYLPPTRTLLTQYVGYILAKMYSGRSFYKDMIIELYKI